MTTPRQNEWKLPLEGGCLCGATRFAISTPPLVINACHCLDCQKLTASAFSLTIFLPATGLAITKGETTVFEKSSENGRRSHQHFCPACHGWLYSVPVGMEDFVALRAPMLDDAAWIHPTLQLWTDRRLPFVHMDTAFSYERDMPMEDVPAIIEHFAANGARP